MKSSQRTTLEQSIVKRTKSVCFILEKIHVARPNGISERIYYKHFSKVVAMSSSKDATAVTTCCDVTEQPANWAAVVVFLEKKVGSRGGGGGGANDL